MHNERNQQLKRLFRKDREFFQDHESELRHCEKVWDVPMIYSHTDVKEGDTVFHELTAFSSTCKNEEAMTPEQRYEAAKQEYLKFSSFNEDGDFVGDVFKNPDAINTDRVFTKQSAHTRHRFKPYKQSDDNE